MPPLRTAILAGWDVRNPEPLVSFIELWTPRTPGWILANILDSQVEFCVFIIFTSESKFSTSVQDAYLTDFAKTANRS